MIEESRVPFLRRSPRMKPELANGDGVSEGGRTRTGVTHGAPLWCCVQLPAGGAHVRQEDRSGLECGAPTPNTDETTLEGWVTIGRGWMDVYSQEGGDRDIIHSLLRRWKDLTNASSLEG